MFVLDLFGTLSLRNNGGPIPAAAQQKRRLGLLAVLALGGKQGISRHRIEAFLWSESTSARARHALDQTIYAIRQALGADVILATGQELRLNPEHIGADVWEFDDAVRAGEWSAVADLYKGTLLDGFHFGENQSQDLESWIDAERGRRLQQYQLAVESLADRSNIAGDHAQVVAWRRKLADSDPLSAGLSKKLIQALAAAGDRAGAVKHARQYQELVRNELEIEPDSEIERLALSLSSPSAHERSAPPLPAANPPYVVAPPISVQPLAVPVTRTRTHQSRIAAIASICVIAVLVIGALTVNKKPSRAGTADAAAIRPRAPLPAARDAYLLGVSALEDRTQQANDNAVVFFRRAAELDPGYAEAYAQLAEAYVRLGYFGYRPAASMFPKAKAAALRSIQLDSTLASARTALATELMWEHDFDGAEANFRRAIALEPQNATAHQWYGVELIILGRVREAVAEEKIASDLEPLNLQIQNTYGTFMNVSGDHAGALRQFRKTVGEEPDSAWVSRNPWVLSNMSRIYADNGDFPTALKMVLKALEIVPHIPRAAYALAVVYNRMGQPDRARREFLARADTSSEQYDAYRGILYAAQRQPDSAFILFERQKEWGIQPMISLQSDKDLDYVRADPRYVALLARLKIPPKT